MGWESRDWAKWTDEERERFYGSRVERRPASDGGSDTPTSSVLRRYRAVMWLAVTALAIGGAAFATRAINSSQPSVSASARTGIRPVIYGWRLPPYGTSNATGYVDRIGNQRVICTTRELQAGRWVCGTMGIIYPGVRVVVLPLSYPDTIAPCSQAVGPGGRAIPCPSG